MRGSCVVVYPDAAWRDELVEVLRGVGLAVHAYPTATAYLAAQAGQAAPSLVVTGLAMPGVDGWRFCRLMRSPAYPDLNAVPVLAVTATFRGHQAWRLVAKAGGNALLRLPAELDQVAATAQRLMASQTTCPAVALVAGPDDAWRGTLAAALAGDGYAVVEAATAAAALAALVDANPSLMVLSDALPGVPVHALLASQPTDCVTLVAARCLADAPLLQWLQWGAAGWVSSGAAVDEVRAAWREAAAESGLVLLDDALSARSGELAESEHRFRSLAEDGPTYVSACLPDGEITYVNRGLAALVGLTPPDLVGHRVTDYCGPEQGAEVMARLRSLTPQQPAETHEESWVTPGGTTHWLQWTNRAIFDALGQPLRYQSVAADITDLKRAESKLRESEEWLKLTLTGADLGAWDVNTATMTIQADERFCEMLGLRPEELPQDVDSVLQLVHPDDLPQLQRLIRENLSGSCERLVSEHRARHRAGHRIWVLLQGRVIERNAAGDPLRACGTQLDITERKQAEEELERSRQRHESMLQTSMDGVWLLDLDGRLLEVNDTYCELSGYRRDELLGLHVSSLEAVEDDAAVTRRLQEIVEAGRARFESQHRRKAGSLFDVEVSVRYRDVDGGRLVVFLRDISERTRADEALRASEERFRCIADYTWDWENWFSPQGELLWVSPSVERIVGYTTDECRAMAGFPVPLMIDAHRDGLRALLARAAAGERGDEFEFRAERKDGEQISIAVSYQPVGDQSGRSLGYRCCIHDITQRRRAEEVVRTRLALAETFDERGLDELIQACLDAVEELTNSTIGFFHFVDPDQQHLQLQTWSTNTTQRMCCADGKGQHYPIGQAGVWVDAFAERRPVIHNDYASLPHRKGLPEGHAPVTRELVVPIIRDGLVRALMGVGNKPIPYTDEDVEIARQLEAMVIDLVDRKKAEEALRDSLQRNQALLDANPDLMFVLSAEGRFLDYRSQPDNERYGTPERYLGQLLEEALPQDVAALARDSLAEVRATGAVAQRSFEMGIGDTRQTFESRIVPCENGTFVAVIRNITGQRESEAERERLRVAIEQADQTIVITDADGVIQYVNAMFEQITGYDRSEAIGRQPSLLKSGEQDDEFYRDLWTTISGGEVWRGRFVNRKKDGSKFTEEASISPVRDAAGRIVNYVAAKRDITSQLDLEAQFLQAQKMESVGRLAGGVAHDLNNLLTPILGYADLLLADMQPEDPRHGDLREIVAAANRAKDLTRQLLAFGRKQILELGPVDLSAVVANFQKLLRRTLREDIRLELRLSQTVGAVLADVGQLEQVLMNLAVNAQDAMPDGGELTITVRESTDASRFAALPETVAAAWVEVTVSDTGTGIAPEVRERLFEPFVTTKESGKGTGLGLATVQGIIAQHGGSIDVASELGVGSTFTVRLPRSDAAVPSMSAPLQSGLGQSGTETIMVVDDDPGVRRMASRILSDAGYRVLVADGAEACFSLLAAHEGPCDLLLTDVVMPGLNGRQLYERLALRCPDLPVLYMTGYDDEQVSRSGVAEEGSWPLQKPFTPNTLCQRVRQVLDSRRA